MKELSIEEKARAYDEVFEFVKNVYDFSNDPEDKKRIEEIFPELREPEDERIISKLKIAVGLTNWDDSFKSKCIAWLEKQGELANFRNRIQIGDKVTRNKDGVLVNLSQLNRVAKLAEKQGEQPKKHDVCDNCDQQGSCVSPCPMKLVEKHGEQKPVQEIEPTPIFKIGDILKRKGKDYTFRVDRIQGGYYHCDRNHGAFFPIEEQDRWELVEQKPVEWSEEDRRMLIGLIDELDAIMNKATSNEISVYSKYTNWLKSLRPQNTWKPSNEQIKTLEKWLEDTRYKGDCRYVWPIFESLYNDLKKL